MNQRFVIISAILALGLVFLGAGLTWAGRAQEFDSLKGSSVDSIRASASSNLPFSLGDPGTSFGYVSTVGTTEGPFLEDQAHFITPYGVGTDNTSLWIADADTHRALSFGNDGSFLSQIGKGGVPYAVDGTYLDWIADVTVDSQGHVWLVDSDANHIVEVNSAGEFISDIGTFGESGGDNDHFDSPRGIAFDSVGNLYVSDGSNHRIQIFDSSGVYTTTIGVSGEDGIDNEHFDSPRHITIYSDTLYVADAGNHRVQIFDVTDIFSPTHEATIGVTTVPSNTNGYLNWPMGVAVNDSDIYVVELLNYRVQVFDRVTLAYKAKIGGGVPSSIEGDFAFPTDVAVDSVGNIYVADPSNMRVQQFNSSLDYVRSHGTPGVPYLTDELHYYNPTGVDVSEEGSIHIVERMGKRLIKLDSNGQPLWSVGNPIGIGGGDNDSFSDPEDVSVNSLGNVFVADTGNHRIQIYDSNGFYAATIGGSSGTGNNQFNRPYGTAVDNNDYLYVADKNNARVQVFNNNNNYVATLAVTPTLPVDVAVSENGEIYVVDQDLHRVQKYNSNHVYQYTIGVTGQAGDSHGRLRSPTAITVDSDGRVLVADNFGRRVQVFDDSGAYLTTVGGSWGSLSGQMRNVAGLSSDSKNGLFIADESSHHIRVYSYGVPGWNQKNINGFGYADSGIVSSLYKYNQMLYSGLSNPNSGGQLHRLDSSDSWEEITLDGFGNAENVSVADLINFNDKLYAGTLNDAGGGQIWRSGSGDKDSWEMVAAGGFTSTNNSEVIQFAVYSQTIYAGIFNEIDGGEIWRSSTGNDGSWEIVVSNGFSDTSNLAASSLVQYGDYLYAAMTNQSEGAEVWRSETGDALSWTKVITSGGFGDSYNTQITLEVYNGLLYAGTENNTGSDNPGAELWTCQLCDGTDWIHHDSIKGFGGIANQGISSLVADQDFLYALTHNVITGMEVWRSAGGTAWQQIGYAGFGDSNNTTTYWDNSAVMHDSNIYVGTVNLAQGGEIWTPLNRIFLPLIINQSP